jgi:hypothetical protein
VPYAHDENQKYLSFDLVKYPVVSHAQAIEFIFPFELFDARGIRILGQRVDPLFYPSPHRSIESL